MTSPDHIINIMQAYKEGKVIRFRRKTANWIDGTPDKWSYGEPFSSFEWDFNKYEYEVKPREPREFWLGLHDKPELVPGTYSCIKVWDANSPMTNCTAPLEGGEVIKVREVLE